MIKKNQLQFDKSMNSDDKQIVWYIARADLSNEGDAATLHSRADVKAFNNLGWKTTLLSCCSDKESYRPRNNEIIIQNMSAPFERLLYEVKIVSRILFKKNKPDYLFFRGPTNLVIIGIVAWIFRIPFITELNGVFSYRYEKNKIKHLPYKIGDYFFSKKSRLLVAVTEELANIANNEKGKDTKVVVARNGVDFDEIKPAPKIFNPIKTSLKIGFLGKLYEARGIEDAIKAIKYFNNKGVSLRFKAVGGGPGVNKLKQLAQQLNIEKQIDFFDAVSPEKMADVVADCDLMWASYEKSPELDLCGLSPLKIWTYLSLSKPVLIRDPGVLHHYYGTPGLIWIEKMGAEGVIEKLSEILSKNNNGYLENLGAAGRDYVMKNVSWESHASKIIKKMDDIHHD